MPKPKVKTLGYNIDHAYGIFDLAIEFSPVRTTDIVAPEFIPG